MDENQKLNELLRRRVTEIDRRIKLSRQNDMGESPIEEGGEKWTNLVQWTTSDDKRFVPASHTKSELIPGVYEVVHSAQVGIFFEKIPVKTEGLIRFPQTNSEKVVEEIERFWEREGLFKEFKLSYKRGIILWGPPGAGKSCTIQLVMKGVIDRGGIVIKFTNPNLFIEGMRILREIQKATPVVVLMEDIDATLEIYNESDVLNILDGVDQIERCVFLATTNYPEKLGARIVNRPSRFDKRFLIDYPNLDSRILYIKYLIGERDLGIDIEKWANDTKDFTLAHIKELFVAVVILGDDYQETLETLRTMIDIAPDSRDEERKSMGFVAKTPR